MCFVDIFFFYIGNVSEFVLLMELEKIQIEDQIDWVIKTQVINGFQIYFSFLNRDMFFYVNFTVHNKLNLSYEDLKTWKQPRHWYIYIYFFFSKDACCGFQVPKRVLSAQNQLNMPILEKLS